MRELGITRRYVRALFDLAMEGGVNQAKNVLGDLHWFESVLAEEPDVRSFLVDPRVAAGRKKELLEKVLPEALQPLTRDFLCWVAERGRAGLIPFVATEYENLLQDHQGVQIAQVGSAWKLDDETRRSLIETLESTTGKRIKLVESVDRSLLGGLRIRMGSTMYDGSLRRQLEELRGDLTRTRLPPFAPVDFDALLGASSNGDPATPPDASSGD